MYKNIKNKERGFIALMSAVLVSALMIGFLFTTNRSGFNARFDALDSEFKHIASNLAESCVNQALLKLAQDYQYDPNNEAITIGDGTCYIVSTTPHATPPRAGNSTDITIIVKGNYKNTFSSFQTKVTVANPSLASFVPLPSCYIWTNTDSIVNGQSATLGWNSSNATSMKILAVNNHAYDLGTVTPTSGGTSIVTPTASETFIGIATNTVGSTQCTTPSGFLAPSIIIQPPATCADTVMMLDRTGSMSSADRGNEGSAAKGLLTLYKDAIPPGKVGVGRFGDNTDGGVEAELVPNSIGTIIGQLSNNFGDNDSSNDNDLYNAADIAIGSNSSVGTNIADAVTVGNNELESVRHDPTKAKVLILVSDGEASEPTGAIATSTNFLSPTSNTQNASGEFWNTPIDAYTDSGGAATESVSAIESDRHRFYNFNFPTIPSNATISGIEAKADVRTTTTSVVNGPIINIINSPNGTISPSQWANPDRAFTSNDSYSTNTTNGQQQGYSNFGFSIPSNATIQGIQVTTEAKIGGSSSVPTATLLPNGQGNYTNWNGDESDVDESGTIDCGSSDRIDSNNNGNRESVNINLSSVPDNSTITSVQIFTWDQGTPGATYKTFIRVNGNNTDSSTTLSTTSSSGCTQRSQTISTSFVKNASTDLEVGVLKVGNTEVRIGTIRAIVNYIPAATGSMGIALSSNNGGVWTSINRIVSLDSTESIDIPSGNNISDLWGRSWIPSDFNNGNFALRVQNNSTTGTTLFLDDVNVDVYYTVPVSGPVACQLGMSLSWDGDNNWTTSGSNPTKTQTLSGIETTYTLGGASGSSSDRWGRTWNAGDFVNSKFIARVHAIDPGSNCSDNAIEHLDWLQFKINYTLPSDPNVAATTAANNAKTNGVDIFTIHFGNTSGRNFLASLASGAADNDVGTSTTQASRDLENGDGDNFFVSPSSTDMTQIFYDIGVNVCPAAIAPLAPPTPPSPPPPPPPPPNITIGSWEEI